MSAFIAAITHVLSKVSIMRLMCTVVLWALIIWLTPDTISATLNQHAGFPWAFQGISFASSYLLGEVVILLFSALGLSLEGQSEKKELKRKLNVLNNLMPEKLKLLEDFLRFRHSDIYVSRDNRHAQSLMSKKIITPYHSVLDGRNISYLIVESYKNVMQQYWNVATRKFDKPT